MTELIFQIFWYVTTYIHGINTQLFPEMGPVTSLISQSTGTVGRFSSSVIPVQHNGLLESIRVAGKLKFAQNPQSPVGYPDFRAKCFVKLWVGLEYQGLASKALKASEVKK